MKRFVCIMALLCPLSFLALQAQNSFYVGATGGINLSKFKFTEGLHELYPTTESLVGINGGVTAGIEIQNFTLSTGIQYTQKGSSYLTENFEDEFGTGYYTAKEKLHFVTIPILLGYRKYLGDRFGFTFAMGPSINMGISGKIDEETAYFGEDDVETGQYKVNFGKGVNDDYRGTSVGFQISPGMIFKLNNNSKLTLNVTWDVGTTDLFNPRYKDANDFFDTYSGDQMTRSTLISVGYEYHFPFGDKY